MIGAREKFLERVNPTQALRNLIQCLSKNKAQKSDNQVLQVCRISYFITWIRMFDFVPFFSR